MKEDSLYPLFESFSNQEAFRRQANLIEKRPYLEVIGFKERCSQLLRVLLSRLKIKSLKDVRYILDKIALVRTLEELHPFDKRFLR